MSSCFTPPPLHHAYMLPMLFNCFKSRHSLRLPQKPHLVQVSHHTILGSVESKYRFATTFLICAQTRCRHVVLIFSKLSVNRTMFIHNKVIVYLLISYVEAMKGSFYSNIFQFHFKKYRIVFYEAKQNFFSYFDSHISKAFYTSD